MSFKDKLERMCNSADRSASQELCRHIKDVAKLVAEVLRTGRWENMPIKTQQDLNAVADDARNAAELADAADFISDKVLESRNAHVEDLRISPNFREVQDQIQNLFDTDQVPKRGFIYVAWSARPERFMYVGKARNVERLNLAAHGKLANSAAQVTTFSLIFPSQSREDVLSGLEASVIRVVEHTTSQWPELNSRGERVPPGEATMQLRGLARFLACVAKNVDALSQ